MAVFIKKQNLVLTMKKIRLFVVLLLIFVFLSSLSGCSKVPVPSVKEGRFNFSVTYEIGGEEQTISGVYVCKLVDTYVSLVGNGRVWSGYIENGSSEPEVAIQTNNDGVIYIGLGFFPEYFMSDPNYENSLAPEPTLYIVYHQSDDPSSVRIDSELDFMAQYGIRLISYEYDNPITNNYEDEWTFSRIDFNIN